MWVVMEIVRGGELLDHLIEGGLYAEADASRAIKQAAQAHSPHTRTRTPSADTASR